MPRRCIEPAKGPLRGDFHAIASKSVTHRALVAAAVAEGRSQLRGPLDADDTRRTLSGLRALGVRVDAREGLWSVEGTGGAIPGGGSVDAGASGTTARFLTALGAVGAKPTLLDGSPRLRERPMSELVEALTMLGGTVRAAPGDVLPIRAGGTKVTGGAVSVAGSRSSQFASALLLAAPAFEHGLVLSVPAPRVSFPYVLLTLEVLEAFGATIERPGDETIVVRPRHLRAASFDVEGDHSSASYLFAAVAIVGGRVSIRGLRSDSAQADARFLRDLASLGCEVTGQGREGVVLSASGHIPAFSWNLADAPDLAPTAAVLALFAEGPCSLSGLEHLRLKESDRFAVLADNLARLGAHVSVDGGTLSITPPRRGEARGTLIDVARDHRIAMAFAVAGLAVPGVELDDRDVVAKSYPRFWDDLAALVRTGS
jgi:3-phosphoshikimate 1-carboxyvinyltransferase